MWSGPGLDICQRKEMLPAIAVPAFDWKGSNFLHYERQVQLWSQETNLEPSKRASALVSQKESAARQVCMPAGNEIILNNGAAQILDI